MLGVGFINFLLSKEIWILDHQFTHFVAFWLVMYILVKKFGAPVKKFVDNWDEVSGTLHVR